MSSFDEMCNEAVKRFIKTVAIIDDEATFNNLQPSKEDKDKTKTTSPVTGLTTDSKDAESSVTKGEPTQEGSKDEHDDLSPLDANVVINAFADIGIACCIQRPKNEETPLDRAAKLAATVDVLVIDWALNSENKSLPRDIIKKILEDDKNTGGRMRLIVVYTAHPSIDEMITDLKEDAGTVYNDGLVMNKKYHFIKSDHLRIVILNKAGTANLPTDARIVPFNKLPDNIISEYTELVKGILPSATLHVIAAMREKTHELLAVLNSNLDGAYCLHRALIPEPSDSVDFAMNLITDEIETVIRSDIRARQFVDRKGINPWLNNISYDELPKEKVQQWVNEGKLPKNNSKKLRKEGEKLRKALYIDDHTEGLNGCKELSRLQCTSRDMAGRLFQKPALQLGTILKTSKKDVDKWFLCITPVCDCVRLKEETNFLFLTLYSGDIDKADIIIKTQDGTFEPLIVKKKKLVTIPFKPTNGSDRINAYSWQKQWRVKSNSTSYQWVGELRYTKALAIVHHVSVNTSKVGVDDFEWLRLRATLN